MAHNVLQKHILMVKITPGSSNLLDLLGNIHHLAAVAIDRPYLAQRETELYRLVIPHLIRSPLELGVPGRESILANTVRVADENDTVIHLVGFVLHNIAQCSNPTLPVHTR